MDSIDYDLDFVISCCHAQTYLGGCSVNCSGGAERRRLWSGWQIFAL